MYTPPDAPTRIEFEGVLHSLVLDAYGNPPGLWPIEVIVDDGRQTGFDEEHKVQVWSEQAEQMLHFLFQRFGPTAQTRLLDELAALAAQGA